MFGINESMLTVEFAFVLGALHALEPGHGKTAMAAYMLGEKRGFWHALTMGCSSAISHSASIFLIALLTHVAGHLLTNGHATTSAFTRPLEWASGLLMTSIGIYLFAQAYFDRRSSHDHCCSHHHEEHGHHEHAEETKPERRHESGYRVAALLGIGGGLIPCPTALAAYVSSIGAAKTSSALLTLGTFSLGIATSLTIVGVLIRYAGNHVAKFSNLKRHAKALTYARASLISGVGGFYLFNLISN